MKRKLQFLTKTLLVAAGLMAGASSAWADNINGSLVHTASTFCTTDKNSPTVTVDNATEKYHLEGSQTNQGYAFAEFSFTIPAGHTVTNAVLTWSATNLNTNAERTTKIYYLNSGKTLDYTGLQETAALMRFNAEKTWIKDVATAKGVSAISDASDVTAAITALKNQGYIIFQWTGIAGGANLNGKPSANKPTLVITTSSETLYTATFTETNSLSPAVTIYSDSEMTSAVANGTLTNGTTYYYKAVLTGYNDYTGSFTVSGANPSINFTMTAKTRYTFTVNAVNSVGGAVLETIYTDADSYEGKTHNIVYPKYLTGVGNIVTYSKDNTTYGESKTAQAQNETYTVSYTAFDGVAWFIEGESFGSLGTKESNWNYSSGRAGRGLAGTLNVMTIPAAGTYTLNYAICSNNVGTGKETQYSFYKNNSDNVIENVTDLNHSVNAIKTTGTSSVDDITFAAGDVLQFYSKETKIILDYVLIRLNSVPATIGTTGYTTFASPYALNLSGITSNAGTTTAYYVTASDVKSSSVALTEATGNVAAGTGLILNGTAGATVTIPVVASGTDLTSTNMLKGCTVATDITSETVNYANFYVLGASVAEFQKIKTWVEASNTLTIPAGKAYLDTTGADVVGAPTLTFDFGETTGINAVKGAEFKVNGEYYNLAGQRVAQPTKGLYIVNGKKVVIK